MGVDAMAMIERRGEPAPSDVIEQPQAPKPAEGLPNPVSVTDFYLKGILAVLERIEAQTAPKAKFQPEVGEAEPVEIELTEPAEQPKTSTSKRKK